MGLGIKTKLLNGYKLQLQAKQIRLEQLHEQHLVMQYYNSSSLEPLSAKENQQISSVWGGDCPRTTA